MSQSNVQYFKKLTQRDLPFALAWFERQRLKSQWHLDAKERLILLGDVEPEIYQAWLVTNQKSGILSLPEGVIARLEILIGIENSLTAIVPHERKDLISRWFAAPNDSPVFQGKSIKQYLLDDNSMDRFHIVEKYLIDAVIDFGGGSYS